jgi:hypothetical protein
MKALVEPPHFVERLPVSLMPQLQSLRAVLEMIEGLINK